MMLKAEARFEITETIYHSLSSIIYKAVNTETNEKVVIKTLNTELYDFKSLAKLKHEYALLSKLRGARVVKVFEFLQIENKFSIVVEDFGAVSLNQYVAAKRLDVKEFLDLACEITGCLEYIHNKHVIHKDLNPANIIYNPDSKEIKLIDFGIASEFSFETMQALNPNQLEGTLPYISPEQTGRMNRPVDYRTDFYSLGATLYELASGKLPFFSADPAEIVHCHLAKSPMPVHEVNTALPKTISEIVAKLMAKVPEERYKSTAGIMFDLQKCREQFAASGTIEPFELGKGDIADKFEIPKKLYGREKELKNLLDVFEHNSKGNVGLVLIGGYSGIGKTSLVQELYKPVLKERGMFISGKFDQYNKNTPFSAFFQAINQFCDYILAEPMREIEGWKAKIVEALAAKGRLLTEAVPRLECVIGEQPVLQEVSAVEEQARFKIAANNFFRAIASSERPIVFFMDDVQWADMASLELIESILLDSGIKGLLLIGTYRDNEVNASHPLIRSIEKVKKHKGKIEYIQLGNLDIYAVEQMLSEIVSCSAGISQLTKAIHDKTFGNPFYTIEFLKYCHARKLLHYDQGEMKWIWHEAAIREIDITANVADFLIQKMEMLPEATRELLSIAACLGNHFDIQALSVVSGRNITVIEDELKPAISAEMIYSQGSKEGSLEETQFRFCHDRFQQAGYMALAENIKKSVHLRIARYYEGVAGFEDAACLFVVAEHYSKALDCFDSGQETERVMGIFLKAALAARRSSAFDTARQYLQLVIEMAPAYLINDAAFWVRVYTEYHLVLFSLARFEELDAVYAAIENLAKTPLDLVDSCCIQLISLSNRSRYKEAFFLGAALLEQLGISYPRNTLMDVLHAEIEKYYAYKRNGHTANLAEKEIISDERERAIAKLLNRIKPAGLFYYPPAAYWATIVNANLMIEKGITPWGLEDYGALMIALIPLRNDYYTGNEAAKHAMRIAEQKGFIAEMYRLYHVHGLLNCHWFEPLETEIYFAHEAYKGNLQNGEFEFSCFSFFTSQTGVLECCNAVSEIQAEVEAALSFARKTGNVYALESFVVFSQFVRALQGETSVYGSFNDEEFSEAKHVEQIRHNPVALCYYYIYRALSAVLFGDFNTACACTEKAAGHMPHVSTFYISALFRFLQSLALCKVIEAAERPEEKESLQKIVAENQAWMLQRAQDAPFNFLHFHDLVAAELAAMAGKHAESFGFYEKAMLGAKKHNRPYHHALACELAGMRYLQMGLDRTAGFYLKEAYSAFLAGDAVGKVAAMKEAYKHVLFLGLENVKPVKLIAAAGTTTIADFLDLKAVITATQAISEEIERNKLLEKLMKIIIENSGSSKGHIVLKDGDKWILSVSGVVDGMVRITFYDDKEVDLESGETKVLLPYSIIGYVERTKEPLIIGNIRDSRFSADPYFFGNHSAAVLCFPILSQNMLKGIVYLENHILTEAFAKERIEVLNIFASQAAISLENSLLYTELEQKVNDRTKQLKEALNQLKIQHAELKSTQSKLVQAEKMAGLGTMVAGVAHEINNPTNFVYLSGKALEKDIRNFKDEVLELLDGNDREITNYFDNYFTRLQSSLKHVLDGSNRIKTIVEDLRAFSRLDEAEKKEVSLAEALESTVRIVKAQYNKQVEFVTDFLSDGKLECYPAQLNQVFLNILVNSCQAILQKQKDSGDESRGRVVIRLWDKGKETVAVFEDNGCGMPAEIREKIFDPFFTTKAAGQGTGLGMSISYRIIEKHQGKIIVESQAGKGTSITVVLPKT